ncbi:helix-turn-helix transcriptional regulator [Qipengyuania sp.]|uniref:helix-turn-helix transcriptional regulator n=1 Tax=Qipengyuania sp. TaxID=2004515 RepID=UPI00351483FC
MSTTIPPWSPYEGRPSLVSKGRKTLTAAFADVVQSRAGFPSYELPDIFAAPNDEGENDAARDLVRLNAEHLVRMFANDRLATFARPLGGGEVVGIDAGLWELDDPLPRFATGAFNVERWTDPGAPLTHRIFVDDAQFDEWLAALKPLGPLTARQVDEIVDPQLRAARVVAARRVNLGQTVKAGSGELHIVASSDPPGVGPMLLSIDEVSELIGRSQSSIYEDEKKGVFPERLKLGSSSRWRKDEVLAWIEEHSAKRGGR